jgi:D-aspartate ligase
MNDFGHALIKYQLVLPSEVDHMESGFNIPAYVLGGGMNGLNVVRNLGRNGVEVHWVAERPEHIFHSKFCKKVHIIPNIETDNCVLKNFFLNSERLSRGGVLFSTGDISALHLSELKDDLKNNYSLPIPSYDVVLQLTDKKRFYQSLSKFNIPYPNTYFPENPEYVRKISRAINYPIFIKPVNSYEFYLRFRTKGFVAKTPDELVKYYFLALNNKIEVIFQEILSGLDAKNMFGIEGYFSKDFRSVFFAYCRQRGWPPVFGYSSLRESIPVSELQQQVDDVKNYLNHFKYVGLMEAEWKRDPRDGSLKLLEINPRQSMQNALPSRCGINLIFIAYLDAIGYKTKNLYDYEFGLKWLSLIEDFQSARKTNVSLLEWFNSLKNAKKFSYFATDDIIPYLESSFGRVRKSILEHFREALS